MLGGLEALEGGFGLEGGSKGGLEGGSLRGRFGGVKSIVHVGVEENAEVGGE